MTRTRTVIAVLVAAFAVAATTASSASAGWVVGGTPLTTTAAVASTAEVTEHSKLTFSETTIECDGSVLHTEGLFHYEEITPDWWWLIHIAWLTCSAIAGSNCQLAGQPLTINTTPLGAEVTLEGTLGARTVFEPKTKTLLATLRFEGEKCSLAGVNLVSGKIGGSLPTGQMEQASQELVENTSSGELKVGTAAATLKGKAVIKLASDLPWHFR